MQNRRHGFKSDKAFLESFVGRADELANDLKRAQKQSRDPMEQARLVSGLLVKCADLVMAISAAEDERRLSRSATPDPAYVVLDLGQFRTKGFLLGGTHSGLLVKPGQMGGISFSTRPSNAGYELVLEAPPNQTIQVVYTRPSFGGERAWFVCPGLEAQQCSQRVLKLYQSSESTTFACRACHRQVHDRAWRSNRQRQITRPKILEAA